MMRSMAVLAGWHPSKPRTTNQPATDAIMCTEFETANQKKLMENVVKCICK
jgi:hypothetical protein